MTPKEKKKNWGGTIKKNSDTHANGVLWVSNSPRYFIMAGPTTWVSAKHPGIYSGGGPFLLSMCVTNAANHWSRVRKIECSKGLCIGSSVWIIKFTRDPWVHDWNLIILFTNSHITISMSDTLYENLSKNISRKIRWHPYLIIQKYNKYHEWKTWKSWKFLEILQCS